MSLLPESPWIQYRQIKPQARLRLFCFAHAGGAASLFYNWSESLPAEIEVCPVQLPGREGRLLEAPFSRFSALLDPLAQALYPYLDKPFAFFGHSVGALICFELTRYLRHQSHPLTPVRLCVAGHGAPQLPLSEPPVSHLPNPEFIKELRRLNGTPEDLLSSNEFLRLLLPRLRADFSLAETYTYTPGEPIQCAISAFGGLHDDVPHHEIAAWREQTTGSFTLRFFDGDHFFVQKEQKEILHYLSSDLLIAAT